MFIVVIFICKIKSYTDTKDVVLIKNHNTFQSPVRKYDAITL